MCTYMYDDNGINDFWFCFNCGNPIEEKWVLYDDIYFCKEICYEFYKK